MSDRTVNIVPRFAADPAQPAPIAPSAAVAASDSARGIMTSLSENKLVALLIVLVVALVGVVAYLYRSSTDTKTVANTTAAEPVAKTAGKQAAPPDKDAIREKLKNSKAKAAAAEVPAPSDTSASADVKVDVKPAAATEPRKSASKTDEDIMQLMDSDAKPASE